MIGSGPGPIGILQGRLTPPWNGELQCFPRGAWEREFRLAQECGFDALELIAEAQYNAENPIWSEDGRKRIRELAAGTGVSAETLCADCFMSVSFAGDPSASAELLSRLAASGVHRIVLPFLGPAQFASLQEADRVIARLSAMDTPGVELAIESALAAEDLGRLLESTGLGVCYDLGNMTALGRDLVREIHALGPSITHVHVKDKRRADGQNMILGTGDTDLAGAFAALRDVEYSGGFTLETTRGDDPLLTARRHRELVAGFLQGGCEP
jgi:sugar phosphate isomerase/epimerase